jgi:photosystem II stability/assembly factor-like uncharacterized protein
MPPVASNGTMKPSRLRELSLRSVLLLCGLASCRQLVGIEEKDRASPAAGGMSAGMGGEPSAGGIDDLMGDYPGGSAPSGGWVDVTANLVDSTLQCGSITALASKPDEDLVIAGVASHGLWMSRNGGASWAELGVATPPMTHQSSSIVFDPDNADRFWVTGTYGAPGVYRTDDGGRALIGLGDLVQIASLTVDFTDAARKTLLAGGHENGVVHLSTDAGANWETLSELPGGNCSVPLVLDARTWLMGCDPYAQDRGIYRSIDGGANWSKVSEATVLGAPLLTSDTRIYWLAEGTLLRSSDGGKLWQSLATPLSQTPIALPDGWLASVSARNGMVVVSADYGNNWQVASPPLPVGYVGQMLTYSPFQRAFFAGRFLCEDGAFEVPPGSIVRHYFDYLEQ